MAEGGVETATDLRSAIPDVFISYASQDAAVADAVCGALEHGGVYCWIAPRNVTPGEVYAESIVHAIDSARVIVLVLSQHGAASQHVLREVERASSKRHPVVTFRIDTAPLPAGLEYFLNSSQWLDASATGTARALPRLVDAVKSALAQPSAAVHVSPSLPATAKASRQSTRLLVALAGTAAAVFAYLVLDKIWLSNRVTAEHVVREVKQAPAATIADKSIAVLPFVDMSEKHDQEYFSDGLSEELIDHLAHIPDLKVIARTSSFAFKGKNEDMRSIASKLGVANLLEGSVRKAGGELRITAQLIRASDGVHLWSETYERKFTDIFKVQDEISTTVANALNIALNTSPVPGGPSVSHGTTNVEAYNLLLQGNYFFYRSNRGDNAKAIESLQQALNLDSRYAVAWAKLARVYTWQGVVGELTAAAAETRTQDAVRRALAIDPNCAEAYYARGIFNQVVGDWKAAKSDYGRALALDPHGDVGDRAHDDILSLKAAASGDSGEVVDKFLRNRERNPLDTSNLFNLAVAQQYAGLLSESAATSRKLLEINPGFDEAAALYGLTLLLMGETTEALAATEKESDEEQKLTILACVYWTMGRRAESDSAVGALERLSANRKLVLIASVYAYRGETDAAFVWLERTYRQRKGDLQDLKLDPLFRNLRGDPRFDALLRKLKLVE